MSVKQGTDPADTYVFDDDVLDEMENLESTTVLPESAVEFIDKATQED